MDEIAERYVRLTLALGEHDPGYVDAYFGPAAWRQRAEADPLAPGRIATDARAVLAELAEAGADSGRGAFLARQLTALATRAECLDGRELSFDDESAALYGVVAPGRTEAELAASVAELDDLLPGTGTIAARYAAFTSDFVVRPERVRAALATTIAECRHRTTTRIGLPEDEDFDLRLVTGRLVSGESRYLGGARSSIEISVDLPLRIDQILDVAAHEGYPGHHVAATVIDRHLVQARGWLEFSVFPVYSPMALVMEGTAVLAPDVAFPGAERLAYEQEVLYPLAGLDSARAEQYQRVRTLVRRLARTEVEVSRRYLSGSMDRQDAVRWFTEYELLTPARAERRVDFAERHRAYVVNYSLGRDIVRAHLDSRGGSVEQPDAQWAAFADLLRSPSLAPSTHRLDVP